MRARWAIASVVAIICLVLAPILAIGALVVVVVIDEADEHDGAGIITACAGVDDEAGMLDQGQVVVVAAIADVASDLDLGPEAVLIAITTALAESQAKNLANDGTFPYDPARGHTRLMSPSAWADAAATVKTSLGLPHDGIGRDWDSLGPFQQRPSTGWGTVGQLMDPLYAARAFFGGPTGPNKGLPRGLLDIPGWQDMTIAGAAQAVQVSAFPDAYNRYITQAKAILGAVDTDQCDEQAATDGDITAQGWTHPLPAATKLSSRFGEARPGYTHAGDDLPAPAGTPIYAAAAGVVVESHCHYKNGRSPCQIRIDHRTGIHTLYVHMYPDGVHVRTGKQVGAGDHIADVGSNGNSTGPHLHLEVWDNGRPINPVVFFADHGITLAPSG